MEWESLGSREVGCVDEKNTIAPRSLMRMMSCGAETRVVPYLSMLEKIAKVVNVGLPLDGGHSTGQSPNNNFLLLGGTSDVKSWPSGDLSTGRARRSLAVVKASKVDGTTNELVRCLL